MIFILCQKLPHIPIGIPGGGRNLPAGLPILPTESIGMQDASIMPQTEE